MLELSTPRLAVLKEKCGNNLFVFVHDAQLTRLRGMGDGLINRGQVEIPKTPAEFQAMAGRKCYVVFVKQSKGELFAKILEKRRHAADQFREITAPKSLEAHWFPGAHEMAARLAGERLEVAKHVTPRQISVGLSTLRSGVIHLHDSPIYDIKGVTFSAPRIYYLSFQQVLDLRKFAYRPQFHQFKGGAKSEEVPIQSRFFRAKAVQASRLTDAKGKNIGKPGIKPLHLAVPPLSPLDDRARLLL